MSDSENICSEIAEALPNIKSGTLRFWGEWFGRPHDNWHTLVKCEADQDVLKLYFNEGETLSIWSPKVPTISSSVFKIVDAARVRWEWFYYGRPKIASNLYFQEFIKSAEGISATTNVDGYKPDLKAVPTAAAVEIL